MSFGLSWQPDAATGVVEDAATATPCACPACAGGVRYDGPQGFLAPTNGFGPNGLPIYDWDQAAAQITRPNASWSAGLGQAAIVTYGFRLTAPSMPNGTDGFVQFNQAQIEATVMILGLWSDVANITFVRNGTGTTGPAAYTDSATMLFGNYTSGADGASAFAYYPGSTSSGALAGDVWVNFSLASNVDLTFGTFGPHTLSHEIGHAIGLAHPAPYDALSGNPTTYPESAVYWQDSRAYTVMSYFGSAGVGHSLNNFAAGPQLHDIAAVQRLYGVNMSTRTGDTIYGFNSNTGLQHYTISFDGQSPVFAIWDAGGIDTIDFSGYSTATEIDLREEAFSSGGPGNGGVGVAIGNISIARGAVIENAVGGSNWDTLTGNDANNRFTGNAGFDTISGGVGVDTSVYSIASTSASWNRNPDGTWTVIAGADGTDTLTSIEFLDFTDRDVFLDRAASTLTGDGTSDILLRNTLTGALSVWFVQGTNFTSASLGNADNTWSVHGVGDFNGDGRDDLLWRNTGGPLTLWLMNGATVIGGGVIGSADNTWSIQSTGDFNGDGRDDILWRNSGGALTLWFMNGTSATGAVIGAADNSWQVEGIGDLNGDGHDDILWRNSSGAITTWLMNGAASIGGGVVGSADSSWAVQGLGDFNGDGRDDILWRNSSGALTVWFMNGAASVGGGVIGFADSSWQIQSVGDYNGDGRDDILWRNSDDAITVWFMNGTSATGGVLGVVADEVQIMPGGG